MVKIAQAALLPLRAEEASDFHYAWRNPCWKRASAWR